MATSTSVHLKQERSLAEPGDPGEYKLVSTFSDPSVGFTADLILVSKEADPDDDVYQHVCTVGDINRYVEPRSTATAYYRVATWTLYFDSLADLDAEAVVQRQKTGYVVSDWQNYTGGDIEETLFDDDITSS